MLITDEALVAEIAGKIAEHGAMAFDLEFASDGRHIPELALLQVAWGPIESVSVAAIDCVAVDPSALLALIASDEIVTIAHSAKQDLGVLRHRFDIGARALWDTQIGAAFLGIGDQVGYARLADELLGLQLDKGAQFTAWLQRPLTDRQLAYALDDVRYLPKMWSMLESQLIEVERLEWVREESRRLADSALGAPNPQDAYREVKGWKALRGKSLLSLVRLAAWRQQEALDTNKPLSWIMPDRAMIEACRSNITAEKQLRRIHGVGDGTIRRYGDTIMDCIVRGAASGERVEGGTPRAPLSPRGQVWAAVVLSLVHAQCAAASISPRFVGTRAAADERVAWFERGADPGAGEGVALLHGWRRELAGDGVLAWLRGDATVTVRHDGDAALDLVLK